MDEQLLEKIRKIYENFSPALSNGEVYKKLESDLPKPSNPLAATGKPFITDARQLADSGVLDEFSKIVKEIVTQDNQEEALRAITLIEDSLLPLYVELQAEKPEVYSNYQKLLVFLKFIVLRTLPLSDIETLVQKYLLTALQNQIRVQEKFQEVLDVYDDILLEGKIAESLANAMLNAQQKLSKDYIISKDKGGRTTGTLGNYLKDYKIFTLPVSGKTYRVSSVERLAYLNQDPNSRGLSKEDREILLKIFSIYDWLRFGQSELIVSSAEPVYLKRERLIVPPVVERKAFTTGQAPVAPKAPPPPLQKAEEPKIVRAQEQKPKPRVLPPPPKPPVSASIKYPVSSIKKFPPLTPPAKGGETPNTKYSIPDTGPRTEELYRKTLEELKRMRQQQYRDGEAEPPAISEQLIQAGQKGKILDDKAGEMTSGQQEEEKKPPKPKEPDKPIIN